eukprot:1352838-Alexandrium_andersonii.AAC.1
MGGGSSHSRAAVRARPATRGPVSSSALRWARPQHRNWTCRCYVRRTKALSVSCRGARGPVQMHLQAAT